MDMAAGETSPTWRWVTAALVCSAGLLVAACGDDDSEASAPTTSAPAGSEAATAPRDEEVQALTNPCDLVEDDEVAALVGPGATPDLQEGFSDEVDIPWRICLWTAEDGAALSVAVMGGAYRYEARLGYAESDDTPDPQPLEGLGDEAFVLVEDDRQPPSAGVDVLLGDRTLEVIMQHESAQIQEDAENLTRAIVERL